jgi:RecA-family ATPase
VTERLCCDPAPNHSAALMRVVGTHNSKYDPPAEVQVIRAGMPVDLTDVEAFLDLYPGPLFTVKQEYTTAPDNVVTLDVSYSPIDYEAVLADMPTTGQGINSVQYRLLRALIVRDGRTPQEAVDILVNATMDMAASHHPDWTAQAEVKFVTSRMNWVLGCLQKQHWKHVEAGNINADAIPDWLPAEWHETWLNACREGRPNISRNAGGWYVRCLTPRNGTSATEHSPPSQAAFEAHKEKLLSGNARFTLKPRGVIGAADIPQRRWLGGGQFYQRRTVSTTIARGDTGKTTIGTIEGVSMITGRNLLSEQPDEQLRVWIHNGEDSRDELDRKLAAICLFHNIPPEEIAGIFVTTAADIPLRVATGYSELHVDKPLVKCIHEQIGDNKIDAAIFDPLITLHGVPEGDNGKMDQVIRIFADIADAQNCSVGISQHVRKGPAEEYDYRVDDARGASAVRDAVRAARVVNRMSEKQALDLGIPIHERAAYIRIDRAKGNYTPAGGEARWLTFDNVTLPQGDNVGVLKPWSLPALDSAEAAKSKANADKVFLTILRRFANEGRRASDRKGVNYAPRLFAREREAKEQRLGIAALEKAMRRLLDDFQIKMVDEGAGGRIVHELVNRMTPLAHWLTKQL